MCDSEHPIAMKIYRIRGETLVAACDCQLLGKKFEEGELQIEVKRSFYFDSFVSDLTFLNSMKIATIANLVGEHVVALTIRERYIEPESVIRIQGVPHAQMCIL